MKKIFRFVVLFLCFIAFAKTANCSEINELTNDLFFLESYVHSISQEIKQQEAKLPSMLIRIEANAFDGTSISSFILPHRVELIGEFAFANNKNLRYISISSRTISIEPNAFSGSNHMLVINAYTSHARNRAKKDGIPFCPNDSFYTFEDMIRIIGVSSFEEIVSSHIIDGEIVANNSKYKQTGRLSNENAATSHIEYTAFHIQGRSPPMVQQ